MNALSAPKNLTRNVLIGMAAGILVASTFYYLQGFINEDISLGVEKYIFNLGGQIFKNLLMLVVVPLVFFSLVSGISSLSNMVKLGSIATKTIGLYLFTTAIAVSLALFFGWAFNLSGFEGTVDSYVPPSGDSSLYGTVLRIFPNNIFGAFIENNMLGIVFISILFGLALNLTDDLTNGFSKTFERFNIVFLKIVLLIMTFAPIGVFCLMGSYVMAKGLNIFGDLAQYVLILIFVLAFHLIFTYSLILKSFANLSPLIFFRKMKNVALFAFSTSSSAATIPVTLKAVTDDLGVKKDVSSFVVPVGATINMDGTAIMQGLATMFIASTVGVDLTLIQYGQIVILAIVTSIGTAAVPSAGTVTLALILGSLGLPLDAIGLILAVDRILDMIRTAVNVCGDAAVSCIVAKSENELDLSIYNSE
ncbi:MAG TPA: dicarboxylate/amino acid:cation symporter [Gammaproteobacteria bacterium]|jgi:Na+/H+-dicarboxylate symporter|nr:dicarboxylate/amino acid:cation symporter [Gammaproteobacteria bacterium]HIA43943.1 dicarboxylate/amino acid:cation symporter [Gammaproteobacteria bacterium]HIB74318.1 dicarboxylate/amino acid:cation symporter [Gammaproteobacteria bacterium]HIG50407.1 dicarboxylate/amino acid:cation symporter [Gammaproteobacteria bacterium]HIM22459.1 dicarboxylate/amino acid:cation symporter [Gammaproteobacteria bacterium]|tara:strand:- start:1043 stop:2302 length:1260 start_codon:yes stop_codon:yes gene_type:complete